MTETTARIRWHDKTPGNGDVYVVAHIGYVGTVEEAAFIIYTPDELHDNWLLSVRLTPGSQFLYADSADELKAEAERWLERFVSSLGAAFPEADGAMFGDVLDEDRFRAKCDVLDEDRFRAKFAPGCYVRYQNPDAGWPGDQDEARKLLAPGRIYGIAWSDVGQSNTSIGLVGVDGFAFNSVLFEPVDDGTAATAAEKENQP